MEEVYATSQADLEINQRLRDLEDRQKILNERVLLATKTIIEERSRNFSEIQEIKSTLFNVQKDMQRLSEVCSLLSEQISNSARKEELNIIQRQLDILRN